MSRNASIPTPIDELWPKDQEQLDIWLARLVQRWDKRQATLAR